MAYDLPSNEIHTRIVTGPDGLDCIIAMEGWYWNALDWLHAETDWKDADFLATAWRSTDSILAQGIPYHRDSRVSHITQSLKYAISLHINKHIEEEGADEAKNLG